MPFCRGATEKSPRYMVPFLLNPQPTNYIIKHHYDHKLHHHNEYWLTAMLINCKCLLMVILVTMSQTDTFDLHAVRHHQPSGCGKESSGLSKYHQRKHFERHSLRSRRLIASIFYFAATMARPGWGDRYAGLAEGDDNRKPLMGVWSHPSIC